MMTPDEQRFWDACCVPGTGMDLIPEVEAELSARLADAKLAERRKRTTGEPVADDLADLVHTLVDERVRLRESHAFWLREITAAHKTDTWQPIETAPKDWTPIEYRGEGAPMTTPDTITLGSRVFVRADFRRWLCDEVEVNWTLTTEGSKWRAHCLDDRRVSSQPFASPINAYRDLLSTLADEHENQARALREELGRV